MSDKKQKFGDTELGAWMRGHPDVAKTIEGFAEVFGISRTYLTEILGRTKQPGRGAIERIHQMTNGAVSPSVWFDEDCHSKTTTEATDEEAA